MPENPFKIIEPREQVPEHLKKGVMGSVKTVVLMLRLVQLFVGDFSSVILTKLSRRNPDQADRNPKS